KKILESKYLLTKPFVSKVNAEILSSRSMDEFINLKNNKILISIGCVGSIKTYYEKVGDENAWIYLKSSQNQNYYFNLKFNKNDKLSRKNQDELINISILFVLKKYIDNKYEFKNIRENLNSVFSKLDSSLIFEEGN
ncbi:MAG: hypothetical protein VXW63_01545, partial [Chloroflexota bacterium]|nr:hypothetical protein [Chloroflexota bacterium]